MDEISSHFRRLLDDYGPLSAEDERALFDSHDREKAMEKLVLCNLRLAASVASRYYGRTETPDDLLTIAITGLVKAVQEFDPSRGVRFSTFAVPKIKSAFGVIANESRVDVKMQQRTLAVFDEPVYTDDADGEIVVGEAAALAPVSGWNRPDPGRHFAAEMETREIDELIDEIDRKHLRREKPLNRWIARMLFRGRTYAELARTMGVTREAVCIRMRPVLKRLRSSLKKEGAAWR